MPGRKSKENRSTPPIVRDGQVVFRIEFGERIRWLLDQFANRSEAAEVAGVTPEHLASYIAGRAKPPFELIARLAAAKNVSLLWLATGEGPRHNGPDEPEGFVAVPVQPDADARFDAEADTALLFSRAWLRAAVQAPEDKLRIVTQRGDVNEPTVRDGDTLLVDTTIDRIAEDALYVLVRDGRHEARFVETYYDGRVALKSRHPHFEVQTVSPDDMDKLQIFGRVRWRGGPI